MKKWYWIELIGFDNTSNDLGVGDFLSRTGTTVEGVSLLFANLSFALDGKFDGSDEILSPCCSSYGGYLHGEERDRQVWTGDQLSGLIGELHRYGIKVFFSLFDFFSFTDDFGRRVEESDFIRSHREIMYLDKNGRASNRDVCPIKRLSDGRYFEDVLIEKLKRCAEYYGFDGIQIADGLSSMRPALQNGDMGDDIVSQFVCDTGIDSPDLCSVGDNKKAYKMRRKYIIENLYPEWVRWSSDRYDRLYKKLFGRFSDTGIKLYVNSVWTRDPFEAYLRYGIDMRSMSDADAIMDEWAITSNISSVEDKDGVYLPLEKLPDYLYEFTLTQQSIKSYLPNVKQYTMSSIKDSYEQWELMNVAPTEQESAFFHRNNNLVYCGMKYENASDGPWYCLSSGMKAEDWARLNVIEEVSEISDSAEPFGFLNVWRDSVALEAENYLQTHDYSQTQLKYEMFANGLCLGGAVRAEHAGRVRSPLLVTNPNVFSDAERDAIEMCGLPTVILGRENNISGAVCAYQGKYISVWLKNIECDLNPFSSLAKFDKPQKCRTGSYLDHGGLWTHPLRYNKLPSAFFRELSYF